MKCPVCKTECNDLNICQECGFSEVGKDFINQEEAQEWFISTVVPYRNKYQQSNVLPPIDWLELFKQNPQAKHLFEFAIPVSIKRRLNVDSLKDSTDIDYNEFLEDATLGHVAVISKSEMIRKRFMEVIEDQYLRTTNFKRTASAAVEREGDLAAVLTGLCPGESLLLEMNSKFKKSVAELLAESLKKFHFDFVIGKGPGARNVGIDLPYFTTIIVADSINNISENVIEALDFVIEFNPTQTELDELEIQEMAVLYDVQLTKSNIKVVKECNSTNNFKNIKGILKYISDYLYLHTEIQQPLTADEMREIIKCIS